MYDGTSRSEDFVSPRRFVGLQDTSELKYSYDIDRLKTIHGEDFLKWNSNTSTLYGCEYYQDYNAPSSGIGTPNPVVYDFEYRTLDNNNPLATDRKAATDSGAF